MEKSFKVKSIKFLLLTFGISWLCWGSIVVANQFGLIPYGTPLAMILFIIGGNGAPIASYILLKKWGEIDGFKSFLKRNFAFKTSVNNYNLIALYLIVHFALPILFASADKNMAVYYGILLIPVNMVGGGFEEIGWRGILQPYLEKFMSFTWATIIVAAIWSVWHLPLWFIAGTNQYTTSFLMFAVSVFGLSFILASILKATNNIFLCILFHSCINSFLAVFMPKQNFSTFITTVVEILIAMLTVFVLSKVRKQDRISAV